MRAVSRGDGRDKFLSSSRSSACSFTGEPTKPSASEFPPYSARFAASKPAKRRCSSATSLPAQRYKAIPGGWHEQCRSIIPQRSLHEKNHQHHQHGSNCGHFNLYPGLGPEQWLHFGLSRPSRAAFDPASRASWIAFVDFSRSTWTSGTAFHNRAGPDVHSGPGWHFGPDERSRVAWGSSARTTIPDAAGSRADCSCSRANPGRARATVVVEPSGSDCSTPSRLFTLTGPNARVSGSYSSCGPKAAHRPLA